MDTVETARHVIRILGLIGAITVGTTAQSAVGTTKQIEQAIASRQFPRALQLVDRALRRDPRDPHVWTFRGAVLSGLGARHDALEAYRRALTFRPSYIPALEGAAQIQYTGGDPEAETILERIVKLQPANEVAHAMLGELAYGRHDCNTAVAHFVRAGEQKKANPDVLSHFGGCLFQLKRPYDAAGVFRQALSRAPDDANLRFNMGLSLLEANQPGEAVELLQPLTQTLVPEADSLTVLAEAYESAGQTANAISALRRAVELYPREPQHYRLLAALCIRHDAYGLANEIVDAGIHNAPDSAILYTMRGLLYALTGQVDKAGAAFDDATRVAPGDADGRLGLAITLFSAARFAESARVLREVLVRDPRDARANYFLARVLLRESNDPGSPEFEEAKAAVASALMSKPDFAQALLLEAKIYLKLHRESDAIRVLEKTVQLDPTSGSAIYQLSIAYSRAGRKEDAAKMRSRILDLLVSERTQKRVHLAKIVQDNPSQD